MPDPTVADFLAVYVVETLRPDDCLPEYRWRATMPDGTMRWGRTRDDAERAVLDAVWVTRPSGALDVEMKTYRSALPTLLSMGAEGSHVLISGTEIIGIEREWEDALDLGYRVVGLKPFLVKKITEKCEIVRL